MAISLNSVQKSRKLTIGLGIILFIGILLAIFLPKYFTEGTVTVTAKQGEVNVSFDPSNEEANPNVTEIKVKPSNKTPFSASLPVGRHTLMAGKSGYGFTIRAFDIRPHQETKIEIDLPPIIPPETPDSWKSKLPFQDQFYYVEYDAKNDLIIATLTPPEAVQTTKQAQIDYLKREVSRQLASRGVDLSKQKIKWVAK